MNYQDAKLELQTRQSKVSLRHLAAELVVMTCMAGAFVYLFA